MAFNWLDNLFSKGLVSINDFNISIVSIVWTNRTIQYKKKHFALRPWIQSRSFTKPFGYYNLTFDFGLEGNENRWETFRRPIWHNTLSKHRGSSLKRDCKTYPVLTDGSKGRWDAVSYDSYSHLSCKLDSNNEFISFTLWFYQK